jgi:formate/nitrite transporter FocA (FNT family)
MSCGAKTVWGKIAAVFFPVMLFVLCGFEHSIANMFYLPAGMMESARNGIAAEGLNIGTALVNNLLPVTLGNIIGGAGMVGATYYLIYLKNEKKTKKK